MGEGLAKALLGELHLRPHRGRVAGARNQKHRC